MLQISNTEIKRRRGNFFLVAVSQRLEICSSIPLINLLQYALFLCIIMFPLNCATPVKKEPVPDMEKKKPAAAEPAEPSFITKLQPEMLEDRSRIYITATRPVQYTAFKLADPLRLILDISDMRPKPEAKEPIPFNKGAINTISTHYFDESNISRVIIGLDQNVPHDIRKTDDNVLIIDIDLPREIKAKAGEQQELMDLTIAKETPGEKELPRETLEEPYAEPAESEILIEESKIEEPEAVEEYVKEKKKYTGQLISLDFQNADLINILRLIAKISGLNIITSPEVKGTVTLRLMDVPWDQALDLILKNNQLGMQRKGNIIRITTLKRLTEEKEAEISAVEMEQKSKKSQETVEDIVSTTVRISYATLSDLQKILDGVKSNRGDIKIDERTKTLIIHDIKSKVDEMKELIKILDERTRQVSIEARIVEVNTNYSKELGIQWGGSFAKTTNKVFPNTVQLRGGLAGGALGGSVTAPNFLVDLPAAVGAGAGSAVSMSLGSLTGAALLDIRLSAMEDSGMGKILSSPRITTANHIKAQIKSGRSIPYETVSSEGTQTQFVDATISLEVTPHITPDGFIHLEIKATKNEADFGQTSAGGAPTILTKEAQTEVLVRGGETTVLGGLYKTTKARSDSGVPLLSKVPIIKWLFKKESDTTDTEELLIFITPKMVEES